MRGRQRAIVGLAMALMVLVPLANFLSIRPAFADGAFHVSCVRRAVATWGASLVLRFVGMSSEWRSKS
jgi:hypothetical protein